MNHRRQRQEDGAAAGEMPVVATTTPQERVPIFTVRPSSLLSRTSGGRWVGASLYDEVGRPIATLDVPCHDQVANHAMALLRITWEAQGQWAEGPIARMGEKWSAQDAVRVLEDLAPPLLAERARRLEAGEAWAGVDSDERRAVRERFYRMGTTTCRDAVDLFYAEAHPGWRPLDLAALLVGARGAGV